MAEFWPTAIIAVVVVVIFLAMWLGWRRRARRDSGIAVLGSLASPGEPLVRVSALHVGSTHHDRPLDRVVIPGLAFRANATVVVSTGGITIDARGEGSVAIPAGAVIGAGTATWTIDKAVEHDGLVLLVWRTGDGNAEADARAPVVDTYLRLADPAAQNRLLASIRSLTAGQSGADDVATDTNTGSEA